MILLKKIRKYSWSNIILINIPKSNSSKIWMKLTKFIKFSGLSCTEENKNLSELEIQILIK